MELNVKEYLIDKGLVKGVDLIVVRNELLKVIQSYSTNEHNYKNFKPFLIDQMSKIIDLSSSFDHPVYIVYEEYVDEMILDFIHLWITNTACNRDNIVIFTETGGLNDYYVNEYCRFHRTRPLNFVETPLFWGVTKIIEATLKKFPNRKNEKQIEYVYNYYGGTHSDNCDKTLAYIVLYNDRIGHCERLTDFCSKTELNKGLELLTEFNNVEFVNSVLNSYDELYDVWNSQKDLLEFGPVSQKNELYQISMDNKCFGSVIRETGMLPNLGFTSISEKIGRCFINKTICFPLNGQNMKWYTDLGYWLPDVVNYDYLKETDILKRYSSLNKELLRLHSVDLQDYYNENFDNILHNQTNLLYNNWNRITKRINEVL